MKIYVTPDNFTYFYSDGSNQTFCRSMPHLQTGVQNTDVWGCILFALVAASVILYLARSHP